MLMGGWSTLQHSRTNRNASPEHLHGVPLPSSLQNQQQGFLMGSGNTADKSPRSPRNSGGWGWGSLTGGGASGTANNPTGGNTSGSNRQYQSQGAGSSNYRQQQQQQVQSGTGSTSLVPQHPQQLVDVPLDPISGLKQGYEGMLRFMLQVRAWCIASKSAALGIQVHRLAPLVI
jgi:hypothetical protein